MNRKRRHNFQISERGKQTKNIGRKHRKRKEIAGRIKNTIA